MSPPGKRTLAAVAALALAAGVGLVSLQRTRAQLRILEACDAARAERFSETLALTEGRLAPDEIGRAAAECRCRALRASGREQECQALMRRLIADGDSGSWAPGPELSAHLVQAWRDDGAVLEAARLARRAGRRHPQDPQLFQLELATRASVEDEESVLEELGLRASQAGPVAALLRASLAQRYLQRGDPERALAALGDPAPDRGDTGLGVWFDTRALAHAARGDVASVRQSYGEWRRAGGDASELRARYALAISISGIADPERPPIELLRDALAEGDSLRDETLHEALVIRLVLTLVNAGRNDEALAVYDRYRARFAMAGLGREELERSALHRALADTPLARRRGTLRFRVEAEGGGGIAGGSLWLSPDVEAPVDQDYERVPIGLDAEVSRSRAAGESPQRWVVRDARGRVRGSGTVSPRPGHVTDVAIALRDPEDPARPVALVRLPGDGRRRVSLVLLDCGDWRIVQYLRTRGELPILDALIGSGHRAVLESDPPLTAAALEALVWPGRPSGDSFVGLVHRMGVELSGLASVGENPFEALSWLLPESRDLFATLGSGPRTTANLLLAHGGIRAGRHGEVTGPNGAHRRTPIGRAERDLTPAERARWPGLARPPSERDASYLRTIAAELDVAREIADAGEIDFMALRVEALDILTHAHFADAARDGQDDGRGLLFDVYRYIDARLEELSSALDADDVLIVMSDHGIRTAMEHSREGLFVATGEGIPHGRAPGRPALRGVSRAVADLLQVATDWPDTGVAPWAGALAGTDPDASAGVNR